MAQHTLKVRARRWIALFSTASVVMIARCRSRCATRIIAVMYLTKTIIGRIKLPYADNIAFDEAHPCLIAVENRMDFHYEVIESAIMQYPLPWNTLNCTKKEVIADVALSKDHHWTRDEAVYWRNYFETHLAGTRRLRTDGAVITFGSIVNYTNYPRKYHAYIGVSCDSYNWMKWMATGEPNFCVLHQTVPKFYEEKVLWQHVKEKICWVNPMHECHFIPSALPQFQSETFYEGDKIRICLKASTSSESFKYFAEGIESLTNSSNVEIMIMGRSRANKIPYALNGISSQVKLGNEPNFYKFEEIMSKVRNCQTLFVSSKLSL